MRIFSGLLAMNGRLGMMLSSAVFFLAVAATGVQNLAADAPNLRLLSRVQVNPPGIQAFVETLFSYNQLRADSGGGLILGFTAVPQKRQDTDVFVSRYLRSDDRWTPPAPIAESTDLERSPAIWIDGQSGAIHAAWVGNERRKPGGPRSELRVSYRRSEDGGTTWTRPRHFPVGTALARRPQLVGTGRGQLYLAISNGYPGGQERIHLFQSADSGGNWRPLDVNFPEDKKRGDTGPPPTDRQIGRRGLPGLGRPNGGTQGGHVQQIYRRLDLVGASPCQRRSLHELHRAPVGGSGRFDLCRLARR